MVVFFIFENMFVDHFIYIINFNKIESTYEKK